MEKGELGTEKVAGLQKGDWDRVEDGEWRNTENVWEWRIYNSEGRREKYLPWCSVEFLGGVLEPDTRKSPQQGLHHRTSNYVFLNKATGKK
jgi:hypothetical protein